MWWGEAIEAEAVPREVFHDLGGELDEVPDDVNAVEGFEFDVAEEVVKEMAEFVEDGFDFVVGEQSGLAFDRRGEVAADEAEVRSALAIF